MRLNSDPFERIKLGIKKTEVRVNDEKRMRVKVEDEIIFSKRPEEKEKIKVRVISKKEVKEYPGMNKLYGKEEIDKYGFVIFDIELLD